MLIQLYFVVKVYDNKVTTLLLVSIATSMWSVITVSVSQDRLHFRQDYQNARLRCCSPVHIRGCCCVSKLYLLRVAFRIFDIFWRILLLLSVWIILGGFALSIVLFIEFLLICILVFYINNADIFGWIIKLPVEKLNKFKKISYNTRKIFFIYRWSVHSLSIIIVWLFGTNTINYECSKANNNFCVSSPEDRSHVFFDNGMVFFAVIFCTIASILFPVFFVFMESYMNAFSYEFINTHYSLRELVKSGAWYAVSDLVSLGCNFDTNTYLKTLFDSNCDVDSQNATTLYNIYIFLVKYCSWDFIELVKENKITTQRMVQLITIVAQMLVSIHSYRYSYWDRMSWNRPQLFSDWLEFTDFEKLRIVLLIESMNMIDEKTLTNSPFDEAQIQLAKRQLNKIHSDRDLNAKLQQKQDQLSADIEIFFQFINKIAVGIPYSTIVWPKENECTPIIEALKKHDIEEFRRLLKLPTTDLTITYNNSQKCQLLTYVVEMGFDDCLLEMLNIRQQISSQGSNRNDIKDIDNNKNINNNKLFDLNHVNQSKETPLLICCKYGYWKCYQLFYQYNFDSDPLQLANVNFTELCTMDHDHDKKRHLVNFSCVNARGRTCLHYVINGAAKAEKANNIDKKNEFEKIFRSIMTVCDSKIVEQSDHATFWTPVCQAVGCGCLQFVRLLIDYGTNLDVTDTKGDSLIHIAVRHNHVQVLEYLLTDISIGEMKLWNLEETNLSSQTPLELAIENQFFDCVKMLCIFVNKNALTKGLLTAVKDNACEVCLDITFLFFQFFFFFLFFLAVNFGSIRNVVL